MQTSIYSITFRSVQLYASYTQNAPRIGFHTSLDQTKKPSFCLLEP